MSGVGGKGGNQRRGEVGERSNEEEREVRIRGQGKYWLESGNALIFLPRQMKESKKVFTKCLVGERGPSF